MLKGEAILTDHEAQGAIDGEIKKYQEIIRGLHTRRNTHAAISKLPNELIAQIFLECSALNGGDDFTYTRCRLMSICTTWREIALATPQLWTFISLRRPQWLATSLHHSKSAPLIVEYTKTQQTLDSDLVETLKHEMHRFKDLRVNWPRADASALLTQFFNQPLPRASLLQKLVIDMNLPTDVGALNIEWTLEPVIMDLFWAESSALWSMSLENALPSSTTRLPSLTHFNIDVSREGHRLSLPWLAEFLQNHPTLENVDIRTISSGHSATLPALPISLPNLRSLTLIFASLKESKLFPHLELPSPPPNTYIAFFNSPDDDETDDQGDPVRSQLRQLISNAASALLDANSSPSPSLQATFLASTAYQLIVTTVEDDPDPFMLSILNLPPQLRSPVVHFTTALPLERITQLYLYGQVHGCEWAAWRNLLPHLIELEWVSVKSVTTLRLFARSTIPLYDLMAADSEVPVFGNHKLTSIHVDGDRASTARDWMRFIDMCRSRAEHGIGIEIVKIYECKVAEEHVRELEEVTDVDWDEDDDESTDKEDEEE
ncbi:hypothetical protein ONZ45_g3331 [Pleurotus djamor]|nr:hypothetical protein ONZ45_g3331 [Pleurotus djamor]